MANLSIFMPLLLLTAFVAYGEALKCWTCSSNLDPACNDPFVPNPGRISSIRLEDCEAKAGPAFSFLTHSKSACKKQKRSIAGQIVTTRNCVWKPDDDNSTTCTPEASSNSVVTLSCETCDSDGCNAA